MKKTPSYHPLPSGGASLLPRTRARQQQRLLHFQSKHDELRRRLRTGRRLTATRRLIRRVRRSRDPCAANGAEEMSLYLRTVHTTWPTEQLREIWLGWLKADHETELDLTGRSR